MPQGKSPAKSVLKEHNQVTCRPLDTYHEILNFLQDPPRWRTLCKEYTPHSKNKVKNVELNAHFTNPLPETPDVFCHYNPSAEEPIRYPEDSLPKTLVCHDMANGYHDDSFIDGTGNYDAYTFYNWAGIDIFCYFSHHLITIPPLGWINVGHAHGVKVIGTVITEWAEGIVFWDKILDSQTEYENFASALVAIATTLKFDGWLLNIENKISKPEMLLAFVKHLHAILHQAIPHAELIWYDSVTVQGNLNWQNGLNEKNRAFFDACDGLFTNYSWAVKDVQNSAKYAGDRLLDLYIGIDVWGRNFYGGGEFNTMEAVKVAYEAGCSLAIFAPAWTHEAISDKNEGSTNFIIDEGDHMDKLQKFRLRDRVLWGSLWPYLFTRVPCSLPFQTSFCKGQGKRRRMYGEVLSPLPWFNLRHQQYQPNSAHGPHGFILCPAENILAESTPQGLTKNGILRYREAYIANRRAASLPTTSVPSTDNVARDGATALQDNQLEPTTSDRYQTPTANEQTTTVNEQTQTADEQSPTPGEHDRRLCAGLKRKMKNALKNCFHLKSARTDRPEPAAANNDGNEHDVGTSDDPEAGPSGADRTMRYASSVSDPASRSERLSLSRDNDERQRGPSMQTVSVTLSLGQGESHRHRMVLAVIPEEHECLQTYEDDSFTGGSCLLINPSDRHNPEHRNSRILWCDFPVKHTAIACVVTKQVPSSPRQTLNVKLYMRNALGQDLRIVMVGRMISGAEKLESDNPSGLINVYPLNPTSARFKEMQCHLLLKEPGFYVPIENSFGWSVRYYEIRAPGSQVKSVNCKTDQPEGAVMLGHFGLCPWLG